MAIIATIAAVGSFVLAVLLSVWLLKELFTNK